jgi:predicted phage terminase large subunit-like protein
MELNFELLKWQQQVFQDDTRFKVIVAGRRTGKSRLAAITLIIEALNCPPGSAVMYVAPTLGQARTIMWDLLLDLARPVIKNQHINNLELTLMNDRKIILRGADNPDGLRGVSLTYLVMDEFAFIKMEIWEKVLRAALSDKKGKAMFISTPSGRNHFYDLYKLGMSGVDDEWKSWLFKTIDNETIDPKEIEAAKRTLSSFAFKQEYLASFDNQGSDLFKEEWLKYGPEPTNGSYYIAIDLAGFKEIRNATSSADKRLDQTAIAIVKVNDNNEWWVKDIKLFRKDVEATALEIIKIVQEHTPIAVGIEKGMARQAVMPYLETLMRRYSCYFHVEELTHGNQRKVDRIVWSLQGQMEHGRIVLNTDVDWSEFIDQLLMFPSTQTHDDGPDALAYIAQMTTNVASDDFEEESWQPMDAIVGY